MIRLALVAGSMAIAVSWIDHSGFVPGSLRAPVALLPVVPLVGFFFKVVGWLDSLDEMQRRIHLEAMVLQFAATGILVMGYGMLARVGAVPDYPATVLYPWLWVSMFVLWSVGIALVRRRYE